MEHCSCFNLHESIHFARLHYLSTTWKGWKRVCLGNWIFVKSPFLLLRPTPDSLCRFSAASPLQDSSEICTAVLIRHIMWYYAEMQVSAFLHLISHNVSHQHGADIYWNCFCFVVHPVPWANCDGSCDYLKGFNRSDYSIKCWPLGRRSVWPFLGEMLN